jgi:putative membrane protein
MPGPPALRAADRFAYASADRPGDIGMSRLARSVVWIAFAALAYFILANALSFWVDLPAPDNMVFVPVFTIFSLVHAGVLLGPRRAALFFGLTVVISYIVEELGVRTGLFFGPYHYSDQLGFKLGHVPVLIPLGWFMMIYPSWVVARALLRGSDVERPAGMAVLALVAALVMTGWDMVMDPPMAAAGVWVWEQGGGYFGVPLHNYLGWIGNTFVIYLAFAAADRAGSPRDAAPYRFGGVFPALPVLVYAVFALQYLRPGRPVALILVAIFSMLMPGLLALARLGLPLSRSSAVAETA